MTMINFPVGDIQRSGYLALPAGGSGRGVLVLHAWWGLNDFFKLTCDRLAEQGFIAFAPDLHHGRLTTSIEEATQILEERDFPAVQATAQAALRLLQEMPGRQGERLGALGFSLGAAYALMLDEMHPDAFSRMVLFYGCSGAQLAGSQAQFQFHFADPDDWEPAENIPGMQAPNVEINIYPNTGHWFFEENRPDAYVPQAAALAWQRSLEFFGKEIEKHEARRSTHFEI